MAKHSLLYFAALLLLVSCDSNTEETGPTWVTVNQLEWQPDGKYVIAMTGIDHLGRETTPTYYAYYRISTDGKDREELSPLLFKECGGYPMPFFLHKDGTQALTEECRAMDRFSLSSRSSTEYVIPIETTTQALVTASPDLKYAFVYVLDNRGKGGSPEQLFTVVDLSGKTYRTVSQDSFPGMNIFSSSGVWLDEGHFAVEGNIPNTNYGIAIIDTLCRVKKVLSRDADNASWSTSMFYLSSQRSLYYTDKAELYKYSLDDSSIVAFNIGKNFGNFAVTPDGEYVVYQKAYSSDGLYVRNIKTAALDTIYMGSVNCFRISPDGLKVAYSYSGGDYVPLNTVEIPHP